MTIKKDAVVELEYTLKNDDGDVIDSSEKDEPLHYLHGHGNIVPGLERALSGKAVGDNVTVMVTPEEGYGQHDPRGVLNVKRDQLPEDLEPQVGMMLAMQSPDGQSVPLTVTAVEHDGVTLDANHPLAGQNLHFDVTVRSIRDATAEELTHGHVHGPGGAHD